MRFWSRSPQDCAPLLTDVAPSGGLTVERLWRSRFRARILDELDAAKAAAPALVDLLRAWLHSATRQAADDLEFGRWHGDWTRWNVVGADGAPLAWDWEFSEPSVPVGFACCTGTSSRTLHVRRGHSTRPCAPCTQRRRLWWPSAYTRPAPVASLYLI